MLPTSEEEDRQKTLDLISQVIQDAFDGCHSGLMADVDEPLIWEGTILPRPSLLKYQVTLKPWPSHEFDIALLEDQASTTTIHNYDELCTWAYALAAKHNPQGWISPCHFAWLVREILKVPCPHNNVWPHESEVTLQDGRTLEFCWDEDECRLRAWLNEQAPMYFHTASEAVGWLTVVSMGGQ